MNEKAIKSKEMKELFQGILKLRDVKECQKFFRDICTISELKAISERFQIAKMVKKEEPYRKIAKKTGASTATVTRVAHWFNHGLSGYKIVLDRM